MSEATLAKARLVEMREDLTEPLPEGEGGKAIDVQFNPDSLKVTFANQLAQPSGGDQSAGTSGRQFVGAGTTKLALTLWFDVTQIADKSVDDVRRKTKDVIHFITPKTARGEDNKKLPPAARFIWGSFIFDGMVEGLEESLEFFSPDGKPLRASVALTISQQKILVSEFSGNGTAGNKLAQHEFKPAKQGDTIQSMYAESKGSSGGGRGGGNAPKSPAGSGGNDWQSVAAGNKIEDPLRMPPGSLVDMNKKAPVGGGFGVGSPSASPSFAGPSLPPAPISIQPPRPRLGLG